MQKLNAKLLFAATALVSVMSCSIGSASAQMTRAEALPLLSAELSGSDSLRGQSRYFSFDAGPGDVNVSVNGSTDFSSTNLHFVFSEESGRQITDLNLYLDSNKASKNFSFHVPSKERIILQIMFPLDSGPHVEYAMALSGQIALNAVPAKSGGGASVEIAEKTIKADVVKSNTLQKQPRPVAIAAPEKSETPPATTDSAQSVESAQSVPNEPVEDKWALVIGTSKFEDPSLNLKYSAKDATDLYNFLITKGNFARDHVKLLVNEQATKERVLAEIGDKWLPKVAHPNDLVLIFISSHGSPSQMDLEGLNYLVLYNTDPNSLYATGLSLQEFVNAIKHRVHSNRVVVVIDACHSGAANTAKGLSRVGNYNSTAIVQGTGQLVICSSEPSQVSWESKRYENGVFTRQLIDALGSSDGSGGLNRLFARMKEHVESEVLQDRGELQSPVLKSLWNGNSLILTAPPSMPRSVPDSLK